MIKAVRLLLRSNKAVVSSVLTGIICVAAFGCADQNKQRAEGANEPEPERVLTYNKKVHFLRTSSSDTVASIKAAVADTPEKRNTGLMNISELPAKRGMLFLFDEEAPRSFWMANTPLSLDIIFLSSEREIVRIHHSTQPYAETNYRSDQPAQYVVEVNGGFCVQHDIQEGLTVAF